MKFEIFENCYIDNNELYEDDRGIIINKNLFLHDDEIYSYSKPNVFRGLHGDDKTEKYLTLLAGKARFFCLDIRKFENEYKLHEIMLQKFQSLHIPKQVLLGFYCFEETIINYRLSTKYSTQEQYSVSYKDIILLPDDVIISDRDENAKKINLREKQNWNEFLNKK